MTDVPDAINGVFSTPLANAAIPLYQGKLSLLHGEHTLSGNGAVQAVWLPSPRIQFSMQAAEQLHIDLLDSDARLTLVDMWPNETTTARVTGSELPIGQELLPVSGEVRKWTRGSDASITRLVFHVPNFRKYKGVPIRSARCVYCGRTTLTSADWRIVLDSLPDKSLAPDMKSTRGYAITHVGELARTAGEPFTPADAQRCMDGMYWFLSFCNGTWTGPILPVGFDPNSEQVYHEWSMPRITPYGGVRSWFSDLTDDVADRAYPGFAKRWADETWAHAIKSAIYWYVISNLPGSSAENGVILTHVAFESLGWTLFVEDTKCLSGDGYNKLAASDKLRLLLNHCQISLDLPPELPALEAAAKAENWFDGPAALADIRNSYVHSSKKNRDRLSRAGAEAEVQAWVLGMYYLELILLRLFDYQGEFSNRLIGGCFTGMEVRRVPWAV